MTSAWQGVLVAALVIGALFSWRRGLAIIRQVFSTRSGVADGTLVVLGTGWARVRSLEYVAAGLVVLAVALEALERRRSCC